MAIGVVTDLGANEMTVWSEACIAVPIKTAEAIATTAPTTRPASKAGQAAFNLAKF